MEPRTQAGGGPPSVSALRRSLAFPYRAIRWPLFRNAFYLMFSAGASVALGAAFWLVAARAYPESTLGVAAALLLVAGLLAGLANLGLGMGLVRFLPERAERSDFVGRTVNASLTLSAGLALLLALVYVGGIGLWTPSLSFLWADLLFVLAFLVVTALYAVQPLLDSVFLAFRRARYILARNLAFGLRVPLLLLGVVGVMGIFLASGLGALFAAGLGLFVLLPRLVRRYRPAPDLRFESLRPLATFSLGNKAAEIFGLLMIAVLPLLIIEVRSAAEAAWFYIAWFLGSTLYLIPGSMSLSLFAEGSRPDAALGRDVPRTIGGTLVLLVPAAIILWFLGPTLLSLFGRSYALEGSELLRWLVLASPFVLVNSLYFTMVRVKKRTRPLIVAAGFTTAFVLGWSFLLLPAQGIVTVGQAFLWAQALVSGAVILMVLLQRGKATEGTRRQLLLPRP